MTSKALSTIVVIAVCYVAAQILADITSLKIVMVGGLSMDAGTLVYPITFTLRDLVHKTAGIRVARTLIFTAAGINIFMAGLFYLVSILPPDMTVGVQAEFAAVLSPVWRIVVASILAEVVAELIDSEVYQMWVNRFGHDKQWGRVLASNSIAVPLDSIIFVLVAFGGILPAVVLVSIFFSNVIVKGLTTIASIPLIYLTHDRSYLLRGG